MISLLIATSALAAACGGGGATSAGPVPTADVPTVTETAPPPAGTTQNTPVEKFNYEIWFMHGEQLQAVHRTAEKTPRVATTAIQSLLAGPSPGEQADGLTSSIPIDTKLLGITVADQIATVDLSSEYESGGGTLSMTARLAQVVFTLTQFPTVHDVRFELDGQPVQVFSGEGIVLDHPVGRADYDALLPVIVVAKPKPQAHITSPVTISGNADVFEANVTVEILDASGKQIATNFTTATCGTGCRGTFTIDLPFTVTEEQSGTVVVHDDDAAGTGTPPHVVEIPVTLVP
jgi:hypothetical protein